MTLSTKPMEIEMTDTNIRHRWADLCHNLSIDNPATIEKWWQTLESCYRNNRHYHTLDHIRHCLDEFDSVRNCFEDPALAELAIWFHDTIQNTNTSNNEEESFRLSLQFLVEVGYTLSPSSAIYLESLFLATKHKQRPELPDAQLIADIDMSIFGQSEVVLNQYERGIRLEYSHYSDLVYQFGRRRFLTNVMKIDWIYHTSIFRTKYEDAARRNINTLLNSL